MIKPSIFTLVQGGFRKGLLHLFKYGARKKYEEFRFAAIKGTIIVILSEKM